MLLDLSESSRDWHLLHSLCMYKSTQRNSAVFHQPCNYCHLLQVFTSLWQKVSHDCRGHTLCSDMTPPVLWIEIVRNICLPQPSPWRESVLTSIHFCSHCSLMRDVVAMSDPTQSQEDRPLKNGSQKANIDNVLLSLWHMSVLNTSYELISLECWTFRIGKMDS